MLVEKFASEMDRILDRHKRKGSWAPEDCNVSSLERELVTEVGEYFESGEPDELVDIANLCMMVWSRKTNLPNVPMR